MVSPEIGLDETQTPSQKFFQFIARHLESSPEASFDPHLGVRTISNKRINGRSYMTLAVSGEGGLGLAEVSRTHLERTQLIVLAYLDIWQSGFNRYVELYVGGAVFQSDFNHADYFDYPQRHDHFLDDGEVISLHQEIVELVAA